MRNEALSFSKYVAYTIDSEIYKTCDIWVSKILKIKYLEESAFPLWSGRQRKLGAFIEKLILRLLGLK